MHKMLEGTEENQIFERFFTISLDLLCITDMEGTFIKVNKSWENVLGYNVKELVGRKFIELVHPGDIEATLDAMQVLSEHKQILNFMNRYKCKDGSYRNIEWRSQTYGNMFYANARDITDIIQTQLKFHDLFENNPSLIAVSSLPDGKFVEVNSAFLNKLGYTRDEIIGKTSVELGLFIEDESQKKVADVFLKYGRILNIEFKVRKKDGSILHGLLSGEIIDNQGQKNF